MKRVLGIEGGATHTTVLLAGMDGEVLREFSIGPANVLLLTDAELRSLFREVKAGLGESTPDAMCVGLAGVRGEKEVARVRSALEPLWPDIPCRVTDDLETALAAGTRREGMEAQVLVLSGTGSCCFGRTEDGRTAKVGGRGHVLGDRGSSCDIGLQGLRAAVAYFDHSGVWPRLGESILARLQINDLESLIPWSVEAGKYEIAHLAIPVFESAKLGCPVAVSIVDKAVESLVSDAIACAGKLTKKGGVQFILSGGTLRKQPEFSNRVAAGIEMARPGAMVEQLDRPGTWGAVVLAREQLGASASVSEGGSVRPAAVEMKSLLESPTEQRNPRSMNLDAMPIPEAVSLMIEEDRLLPEALLAERDKIASLVSTVADTFEKGGRLFYVGAGTSGRLGVLDASECPPTFRSPAEQVQGIIAGGYRALWSPVEGAEDDPSAGATAIQFRGITEQDTVLGIAASGRTPFVHGALAEARVRGASTALLCFNPAVQISEEARPDLVISPNVGPEILTGSTRLKAGTATKMVLNIVTTLAMVQSGKVISNLMVDVNASNEKLRDRAVRITAALTGAGESDAAEALSHCGWLIRDACERIEGN
ncbi:MAG: N-acetylmuramic acid 6-phosphate etherase [Verrucomicrobiales bacterium]|nr:N-acetylmuramic acid 6-phosphate etherase [Verrucomicrobiales bacterium]